MLHYAGGSRYSYQFLIPYLQDFEVKLLELPGRGKRNKEQLLDTFLNALDDIYCQVSDEIEAGRDIIYGHSLGSILGFWLTERLERAQKSPKYLMVSGNPSPRVRKSEFLELIHQLPDQEFIKVLKEMGGMPEELFKNKKLFQYYEPIIRMDLRLLSSASDFMPDKINVPVLALMGTKERNAYKIQEWGEYTNGRFDFKYLDGDHFFINNHPERIAQLLSNAALS